MPWALWASTRPMLRPVPRNHSHGPYLDTQEEPWEGSFPGIGRVTIDEGGGVSVYADPGEGHEEREQALRWGWAEPLSLTRQGFTILIGTGLVSVDGTEAMLLTGDPHDCALVMIELVRVGWQVLGDRITACRWEGAELVAYPRSAPVLVSRRRAKRAGWSGVPVRRGSDSIAVPVPRAQEPAVLRTVLGLRSAKDSDSIELTRVSGLQRFEQAASVWAGGALASELTDSADARSNALMARQMKLAQSINGYILGCSGSRSDEVRRALNPLVSAVSRD